MVPERVSSEEGSSTHHMTCSGSDTRFGSPRPFIFYGSDPGGGGARADRDGMDYVRPIRSGNTNARGIEVLERAYPLTFLGMSLRCDSGGPGRFRGGLGTVREYRIPSDGTFSLMGEHAMIPPAGVFGGYPGALARFEVLRDGETVPISPVHGSKATAFPLKAGDVLRICSQGAGGWGDPLEREPGRVLDDVLDGRVSRAQAAGLYGVILDDAGEAVDVPATLRKRRDLASARLYLRAARGGEAEFQMGVRVAWVGEAAARRIGAPPDGTHRLAEAFARPFSDNLQPAPFRFSVVCPAPPGRGRHRAGRGGLGGPGPGSGGPASGEAPMVSGLLVPDPFGGRPRRVSRHHLQPSRHPVLRSLQVVLALQSHPELR